MNKSNVVETHVVSRCVCAYLCLCFENWIADTAIATVCLWLKPSILMHIGLYPLSCGGTTSSNPGYYVNVHWQKAMYSTNRYTKHTLNKFDYLFRFLVIRVEERSSHTTAFTFRQNWKRREREKKKNTYLCAHCGIEDMRPDYIIHTHNFSELYSIKLVKQVNTHNFIIKICSACFQPYTVHMSAECV